LKNKSLVLESQDDQDLEGVQGLSVFGIEETDNFVPDFKVIISRLVAEGKVGVSKFSAIFEEDMRRLEPHLDFIEAGRQEHLFGAFKVKSLFVSSHVEGRLFSAKIAQSFSYDREHNLVIGSPRCTEGSNRSWLEDSVSFGN